MINTATKMEQETDGNFVIKPEGSPKIAEKSEKKSGVQTPQNDRNKICNFKKRMPLETCGCSELVGNQTQAWLFQHLKRDD